jgi:nucleoside phosphorylase/tetratricopeptide (TPR) repeat protein
MGLAIDLVRLTMTKPDVMKCDVLLVTVTDIETELLLETARKLTKSDYKERPGEHKTYFDLGVIGGVSVFAVRSEMGSDTTGGSLLTVKDAIAEVKPSAVIMVGIAFGVDPEKRKIGDILVAKQLQPYDLQRVGTTKTGAPKITLRGDKPHCSAMLLDRFRAARLRWNKAKVSVGLMLSGQSLIDNLDFRDQLLALSEETIGGEMEGGGLYVACQQSKVDWILVKAICDWADGKKGVGKEQNQKTAAQNAAEFVIEMLASGLLAKPHSESSTTDDLDVIKPQPQSSSRLAPDKISIARLPTSGSDLFGRDAELKLLDDAWANPLTNIITFVAWGGVGKTALVNHWLKQRMARDNYRGAERVYGWSFYSQGTSERAASADLFIDQALRWFGDTDPTQGSPWDKGERLAHFIRQARTLLVLDGLEPLQHPPGPQEGRLKDAALQALLVELAARQDGLCVISTRERVGDLVEFENGTVTQHELEHLTPKAGAQLLRAQQVKGNNDELEQAAKEYEGHALALTLLGSYLADVCGGDIRRRNEIESLEEDVRHGGHAERVMRAYEKWLGEGVELALLRLLGLFDRPAEASSIAALRAAPAIPRLTEALQNLKERQWQQGLAKLRRIKLLGAASPNEPDTLDAHPLVREHFRQQLKRERPDAWREANNRLYEHLKRTAKELPNTVEEMSPLFAAVSHGCAAGRHQEALDVIFQQQIQRGNPPFSITKLGAFGANLAALSGFFEIPWEQPVAGLREDSKGFVLQAAAFCLRALGRLQEATQLLQAVLQVVIARKSWENASVSAGNLSQLYQTLGDLLQALKLAQQTVELADRSGNVSERISKRTTLADALHQAGSIKEASVAFREAEALQQQQTAYPLLFSLWGFRYCDLLLGQGQAQEVKERAARTLEWAKRHFGLLDIALDNLSLGRAWLLEAQPAGAGDTTQAAEFLQRAVDTLRQAGQMDFLPYGLLARAELRRVRGGYEGAERDLAEVLRIATRGGMGLHLADYHLESARLYLAQGNQDKARERWETAREMIERMGYHRRDKEVDEIEQQLR